MTKFIMFITFYLFGATLIHQFCKNYLSRIPLIDQNAWGIRNFLCIVWLIISILCVIFVPSEAIQ